MSVVRWQGVESWQLDPIAFEPKLDYDNYSIWSFKVEVILKSRGLWHLVDGTEVAPTEESTALERWEMRDACARLQFLINIQDRWVWIFKQATTAKEIWTALQEHFRPESIQEIARHAQVHLREAHRRGRGHPRTRTAHGRAMAGCPCLEGIHLPRRGRVLRHHAPGLLTPVVVRIRLGVEGHARPFEGVPLPGHWTHS
jgi:gag-polypeptide of LTR copia-type